MPSCSSWFLNFGNSFIAFHLLTFILLPEFLKPYFWDCAFSDLDPDRHRRFIAERILVFGHDEAVRWLMQILSHVEWLELIESGKHLDPKTRNYWRLVLEHEIANRDTAAQTAVPV